ncbi:MAG TPA: sugar phosphate isomerase/epimerase family protein [Chitinophagaceae bacterium]|nr:sugar phosphate isomerase/epimerase family protein [Chitinophagaceae bacterium]
MKRFHRRDFIKAGAGLFGLGLLPKTIKSLAPMPPLSFSTLGCPDWSYDTILDFAVVHGYQGIEIRGIQREMDLPASPLLNTVAKIAEAKRKADDKGIAIINLGASAQLHNLDPKLKADNIQEAKRFVDLAHRLQCPYIRVFPNKLPPGQDREATLQTIAASLGEIASFARGSHVRILMETHGDLVRTEDILKVLGMANADNIGLVWDIYNMWIVTGQSPVEVYTQLKPYIYHVHLKDGATVNGQHKYQLMGRGNSPVFKAVDTLANASYPGYYSFEWEKLWHPEIDPPELALADFPDAMRRHFAAI